MFSLTSKTAIVTGSTSGIGKATALALAHQGANVVVSGRREVEGQKVVDQIKAKGGNAIFVQADVTKESEVENLYIQAGKAFGKVDIAFLNSGIFQFGSLEDTDEANLTSHLDTNVKGVYYGVKHGAQHIAPGGAIVINSSVVADIGFNGASAYSLTKGAVNTLTRTAAVELAGRGIRVNAIAPGPIFTEGAEAAFGNQAEFEKALGSNTALGRGGRPDEIAAAVVFLASDEASFITGQVLLADGGFGIK